MLHPVFPELLFQSTLPREERLSSRVFLSVNTNFNPRSHERSDPSSSVPSFIMFLFQSTLPREERPHRAALPQILQIDFNPRSHERSDGMTTAAFRCCCTFQSTLPREERQQYCTKNLFIFIQYRQ